MRRRVGRFGRLDADLDPAAAFAHRLPGVGAQIEHDLLDLDRVGQHMQRRGGKAHIEYEGGRFDKDGFYGQTRRIETLWEAEPPADMLELAFGKGINLAYLVPRWPQVRFSGIHLTPRNVKHATPQPALAAANLLPGDRRNVAATWWPPRSGG